METQRETSTLIAADKVSERLHNAAGESLGEIP